MLAAVDAPAEPEAGFRDDRPEVFIGEHVAPWHRRAVAGLQVDLVVSLRGEAAGRIGEGEICRT